MSPQKSNRSRLVEGTLRLLERLPAEQITARAIAEESGANLAYITYHFGSKEQLVTEAVIAGLDAWLDELARRLEPATGDRRARLRRAAEAVEMTREHHAGLVANLVTALAMAQHDAQIRMKLARGFLRTRPLLAELLALGDDRSGEDAAGLVLAMFYGLMLQRLLDPALAVEGARRERALARLRTLLPGRDNAAG